ncbi:SAM-dependent methyltransferase [Knoellia sp. CPCC 206435]|uniref:SAM-dependent methyltransferase n=1 Tax=Knoellia terrae TaxID=3404797 RepID=UPI003B42F91D
MTAVAAGVTPQWLRLREPADAEARSPALARMLVRALEGRSPVAVVHDLGSGTGSMGRWLAPLLPGPQHWVLHDRDRGLLAAAAADPPAAAADGAAVTVETREGDLTRLRAADLTGAALVTASALLDMLTAEELERTVRSCVAAACPALLTLSVTGHVRLTPAEDLDTRLEAAFNDHQRRTTDGRSLLGPDAAAAAVGLFTNAGWRVHGRPSPWRLDAASADLTAEWLDGWVGAACEQRPELAAGGADHLARRRAELGQGRLSVAVGHLDLLALPPGSGE